MTTAKLFVLHTTAKSKKKGRQITAKLFALHANAKRKKNNKGNCQDLCVTCKRANKKSYCKAFCVTRKHDNIHMIFMPNVMPNAYF